MRSFWKRPMRIFGPCRSTSTPTARPALRASCRTVVTRRSCSRGVPWEKFRRTTSMPAEIMRLSTAGSLDAGPRVATIFVLRGIASSPAIAAARRGRFYLRPAKWAPAHFALGASLAPSQSRDEGAAQRRFSERSVVVRPRLQHGDRGQGLAFQELEERAAAGRYVGHLVSDAELGD